MPRQDYRHAVTSDDSHQAGRRKRRRSESRSTSHCKVRRVTPPP
jgi:hypothetical protein